MKEVLDLANQHVEQVIDHQITDWMVQREHALNCGCPQCRKLVESLDGLVADEIQGTIDLEKTLDWINYLESLDYLLPPGDL